MAEFAMAERRANRTNIPTGMKEKIERTSGVGLDDVRVHYHSSRPGRVGALAYTQGNHVYVGAGQERHLPHELGHVIQQKLGMVRPTRFENGYAINDDSRLERQADEIGKGNVSFGGSVGKETNSAKVQYKKMMGLSYSPKIIQKEDGIEEGIIVYCKNLERMGSVISEETGCYRVRFSTGEEDMISKDNVFPMYSNARKSDEVFNSVMTNGILSPRDRKVKRDSGEAIVTGTTTDDARDSNYDEKKSICVNVFSMDAEGKSEVDNTFYNRDCGAYLVALENNNAPKLKLPSVEDCLMSLGKSRENVKDDVINDFRHRMLENILKRNPQEKLQEDGSFKIIDEEVNELLQMGDFFEKRVNTEIFARYLENDSGIKSIFEERLRRTMLVVAPAPEEERGGVESTTDSILPSSFCLVLLPENSFVTTELGEVKKVPCVEKKLRIPARRYFIDSEGKSIDADIKIKLNVPNYQAAIKELPEGKYYSHIVRL